jgi:hypothetical protein
MLCLCFNVFFNWPADSKHLSSAGRHADEFIAPGGKFFMFFMYLILHMNQVRYHIGAVSYLYFWVCVLTCSPVRGGFANNAISIAGQSLPPPRGCSY